jgi:hypothetical protein
MPVRLPFPRRGQIVPNLARIHSRDRCFRRLHSCLEDDPIKPPAARRPEEALELLSQALSDGDLEAALAQYEGSALLAYWPGRTMHADHDVRGTLACFMALRLPLSVRIVTVLETPDLALVICERGWPG